MSRRFLDPPAGVCYNVPMQFSRSRARIRRRVWMAAASLAALAIVSQYACSSDPNSSLGSGFTDDVLGSGPGDVFQDTIAVYADTVVVRKTLISGSSLLEIGREDGYQRAMILQVSYAGAAQDAGRTVESAALRLIASELNNDIPVRFYRLKEAYNPSQPFEALDTLAVIPDPDTGSPNRTLKNFPVTYPLPPELVQGWIRGDSVRTAIAIVYTDDVTDHLATFHSLEAEKDRPQLRVNFTDGTTDVPYYMQADANYITPVASTSNLIVSDGYVRRTYFRVRLDELGREDAVHTARVRFHLVPGSLLGTNTTVLLYVPDSADPASSDFFVGTGVTTEGIVNDTGSVEFPLTNSIFLTLQGNLEENGFVIRFDAENTEVRQIEFYGTSAAEGLRPRVFLTTSTPSEFKRQ